MTLKQLTDNHNIVDNEEGVIQHWRDGKTFDTSLKLNSDNDQFVFLDGPPFINSLPHHGVNHHGCAGPPHRQRSVPPVACCANPSWPDCQTIRAG